MKKRENIIIICVTAVVAILLSVYVGLTIRFVNQNVTQACYAQLTEASKQLAADLYKTTDMDRTVLKAMAELIANTDTTDHEKLCKILSSYDNASSYVSYVELLCPDNTMLDSNGDVRDVSDSFDFAMEAGRGQSVSDICYSSLNAEERVIRNAVPVIKGGKTIYMLYGVVRLSEFVDKYKTGIYDGNAYVYLEDGNTGDFLLDTWHKSFGNIEDFKERKMLPGFQFNDAIADMNKGIGGNLGFVSKTTGQVLYMHYEPVGVNNWNVIITVEKEYAFEESEAVSSSLYRMAAVLGIVTLLYMAFILSCLFGAYRRVRKLGMEDQTTRLNNRNAYDAFIKTNQGTLYGSITCIFIDANGLHEINNRFGHPVGDQVLCMIADAIRSQFESKTVFRIGGDEFVVFSKTNSLEICREKMAEVKKRIEAHDYSISYGIASRREETGVDRVVREADERMLESKREYYKNHDRRQ